MGVDKDALQYAVEISAPAFHADDAGRVWTNKALYKIAPELPSTLEVGTLTGLRDLVTEKIEDMDPASALLHVVSSQQVDLLFRKSDLWGRRQVLVTATAPKVGKFSFGSFQDHETFLIGVLSGFIQNPDRDYLTKVSANIEAGRVRASLDDGISQTVTAKQGVSLKTELVVRNRLVLVPYRTFREVEQPGSEFLFRVRGGSDTASPTLALIEADGGKWHLDAMETIGRYLRTTLKVEIPVVI
jgi:hypothetical protein